MLEGFLEFVQPLQLRGWAFDTLAPDRHLMVEIVCDDRPIGRVCADFYRQDLAAGGVGWGDHAFLLYLETPIPAADMPRVVARVVDGMAIVGELSRLASPPAPPEPAPPLHWPYLSQDESHRPVFILGSARSGTSAIAHALLAATRYQGYEEGHLLDVLAPLMVDLETFYNSKSDEWTAGRNTAIARVPKKFVEDGLHHVVVTAMRGLFPSGLWLDKTPSANMVHLAPTFREIWPDARFIFMNRRAIENVASRLRKFSYDFAYNCREWAATMEAWTMVRDELGGVTLEIDQLALLRQPATIASHVADLLGLDATEQHRLAQQLTLERPQQTASGAEPIKGIDEQGWIPEWKQAFEEICGPMMDRFGYSRTGSYSTGEEQGIVAPVG